MSTPDPLHLADLLEAGDTYDCGPLVVYGWPVRASYEPTDDAAAELRRQHAEIERLNALAGPSGKRLGELERINDDLIADNERLTAERDALREAARLTIAWLAAENSPGHTAFWERGEMFRAAEDALRAALAQGKEPSNG